MKGVHGEQSALNGRVLCSALAIVVGLTAGTVPQVMAVGTDPSVDTGQVIFYETIYPEPRTGTEKLDVKRLLAGAEDSDGSSTTDWYAGTLRFHQLEKDWLYDFPNWAIGFAEHDGSTPDLVNWDPGIETTEDCDKQVGFSISEDPGLSVSWEMDWCGQYDIHEQRSGTHETWDWRYHHEWFDADWGMSGYDWDKQAFGVVGGVNQKKIISGYGWGKMARCKPDALNSCTVDADDYEGTETYNYTCALHYDECQVVDDEVDCSGTDTCQTNGEMYKSSCTSLPLPIDPTINLPPLPCGTGLCTLDTSDDGDVLLKGSTS